MTCSPEIGPGETRVWPIDWEKGAGQVDKRQAHGRGTPPGMAIDDQESHVGYGELAAKDLLRLDRQLLGRSDERRDVFAPEDAKGKTDAADGAALQPGAASRSGLTHL